MNEWLSEWIFEYIHNIHSTYYSFCYSYLFILHTINVLSCTIYLCVYFSMCQGVKYLTWGILDDVTIYILGANFLYYYRGVILLTWAKFSHNIFSYVALMCARIEPTLSIFSWSKSLGNFRGHDLDLWPWKGKKTIFD